MMSEHEQPHDHDWAWWRRRLKTIIFGVDTKAGKAFDVLLLTCIFTSILAVMLESVPSIGKQYGTPLRVIEWVFTILFTIEYIIRLLCVRYPLRYALSFYGIVDFMAIVPTFLGLFFVGSTSFIIFRALRLLRVFRVFKLVSFMQDSDLILRALVSSRRKITAFLGMVIVIAMIVGTMMYLIEGDQIASNGKPMFDSIPRSLYWAIVTMTTVGFGDITPQTTLGQFLASALMITGYCIIAVPTGIVSVELAQVTASGKSMKRVCPSCHARDHDVDAEYCKYCGVTLDVKPDSS